MNQSLKQNSLGTEPADQIAPSCERSQMMVTNCAPTAHSIVCPKCAAIAAGAAA